MASGATPGATRGPREVDPALEIGPPVHQRSPPTYGKAPPRCVNSRGHGTGGITPMHQDPKGARDERAITTWDEDERDQWALLRQVLELHPATLTRDELIRELNGGRPREFSEVDRFERAIRELAGTGLLHRPGEDEMVNPTRAADLLRCKGFYNAFLKA